MNREPLILVINPGSTSTKMAIFKGACQVASAAERHGNDILGLSIARQLPLRRKCVESFLKHSATKPEDLDMIVSRGGLGRPCPAGIYEISEAMCDDLIKGRYGLHASATGPRIAFDLAKRYKKMSVVVDPPSTDEFIDISRISGIPEIERKSGFHALSQKAAARRFAEETGDVYENLDLIVAHMGGGITIGAHHLGQVIDCTHGISEGPFSPERAGALPSMDLLDLSTKKGMRKAELKTRLAGGGGLKAYLGTGSAEDVVEKISAGDSRAELIYRAMAYQIAKDVCAMAAVLSGRVDAVILTGGLANSDMLVTWIKSRVDFLGPVIVYPGEDEMKALALGGIRAINASEPVKKYL